MTNEAAVQEMPAQPHEAQAAKPKERTPKYIEVIGDALSEVAFLRHLAIAQSGLSILLVVAVVRFAVKPPLVIRVDEMRGASAVKDVDADAAATAAEVRNFTGHFTRDLMGWDLYTLDDDLNRALAMMTPEAALKMKGWLDEIKVAQKVKMDALRTRVQIEEISVDRDTDHAVALKIRGSRLSASYEKKDFQRETIFEDALILRKVARTETTPWGLLVEQWSEHVYKESQTP